MSNHLSQRDSQPGLELAHWNDPEVVPQPSNLYPIPISNPEFAPYPSAGSQYTTNGSYSPSQAPYSAYKPAEKELPSQVPLKESGHSRRKLFILIGIIVAVAVIVGAVVGGVLGSKASKNVSTTAQASSPGPGPASDSTSSPSSTSSPLPSSSASPQVNTTAVRANTRLSVTGRRITGNGFTSRLFWQGGDNKIRTSRYASTSGSWSTPLVFDSITAKPGTPIAATLFLHYPQFEVYYLDPSSTFRGLNFGEDETVPKTDSIDTSRPAFTIEENSRVAAYWPYIIYQNANLTFHRQVYYSAQGYFNDTVQGWFNHSMMPLGDNGTGIAVVPVVKAFKVPYAAGIAYRDMDGRLSVFSFGGDDTGISWDSGTPNMSIPSGTAIAAIAVGRANSNTTNTWILYQDDSNTIQAVWQDDDNGWQGPQEVGEADAGTDIACLTEQTGDDPSQVLLAEQTDMRRCYYQYKGVIQEKRLTSSTWVDGDTIPMQ
ncbi:hypothetical protein F5Y06DRAFT_133456 [Hypoxylon sp. FL0890]|nr:hypothetical protein F5Y06DRAFT_133456 [Hypoxylon sp. FL0890]